MNKKGHNLVILEHLKDETPHKQHANLMFWCVKMKKKKKKNSKRALRAGTKRNNYLK